MALASTSPDPPSPLKHLETLYPLACMLVGEEAAASLLVRVYEQATEALPDERPEAMDDWLALLLEEAPDEGPQTPPPATPDTAPPSADGLRREVAERLVQNTLPVVLATCSATERFVLALGATRAAAPAGLGRLRDRLDKDLSDPSALVRDQLQAVLSAPEAALIDETLSDAELREALRDTLEHRFAPVPSSLRARLRATLRSSSPSPEASEPAPDSAPEPSADATQGQSDWHPARPQPRTLLFVLLVGGLVLAGGLGVSYLTDESSLPSSASPPGLVDFSAEQAGAVTAERAIDEGAEAEAYLDSTWGRQVQLPTIDGARLQGVGRLRTADDIEIPVVLYVDAEGGSRIAAFVYSYALVDRLDDATTLDTQVRAQLAQRDRLIADDQSSEAGLLWRDRANIFVVVSPAFSPDSLRTRVQP